jgi:glyoxylase-like metal-dependent hydrolase (beta-lactamase superfamily II)
MSTKERFPEIITYLAERGVSFVTDIRKEGKGAAIANTFFLEAGNKYYLIDPACGKKRLKQIRNHLPFKEYDVLVTHSHLDHSANSGAAMAKNSRAIFHPQVEGRINNLKRNYTEITAEMIKVFGVQGFFGRTGMLGPSMIKLLLFIQKYSPPLFNFCVKMISLIMCRIAVGGIFPPKKNALFLKYDDRQDLHLGATVFRGWPLNERLFALDTPGHQNDHLSFYVPDKRIMFAGDLINFLNPNDILDGSIKDTHAGMMKTLQLAEAGEIDILAVSHALPLIGQENVVAYLRAVIAKQDEIFNTVAEIVASCKDKTDFEEIITKIYAHESDLMKKVLKINYPRSVSFIDVYVYLYMKEFV